VSEGKASSYNSSEGYFEGGAFKPSMTGPAEWSGDTDRSGQREQRDTGSHSRPPRRRIRWIWQIALALLVLIIVGGSGLLYNLDRSFAGRIYPNVSIRGVAVGEMTPAAASDALQAQYRDFLAQPVILTYGDRTWTPTMQDLGVNVAIDDTVGQAYAAGRNNGFIENLREVSAVWQQGLEIPLHIVIDQQQMQAYLMRLAADIEKPAIDAGLVRQDLTTMIVPSVSGSQLLIDETIVDITAAVQSLEPQAVAMRTRAFPPLLSEEDILATQDDIAALLQEPLVLETDEESYEWSLSEIADMLTIERVLNNEGPDALQVGIDQAMVREKLAAMADELREPGNYPRVAWNGGDLTITEAGTPGRGLDLDLAEQQVMQAFEDGERVVQLPFAELPPPVTAANLNSLGIDTLLGHGKSDFSGSAAYRITNIKAGMRMLDGVLLAPGDEFSFNDSVGRIDASNGFVEGYAIVQNRTQLEWGGGICQDSTTMFRAAFWAGLPITERWGHSFYISWYDKYGFGEYGDGPGMDATIFTGGPDLKFLNDTGHWILIDTAVDTSRTLAEVRIYGTDTGRTVELEGPVTTERIPAPRAPVYVADPSRPRGSPRQSDTARGGMTIVYSRIVKQDGVEVERKEFVTRFRPWPNIFEINPADLGPNGRPGPARPAPTATPDPAAPPPPQPTAAPPPEPAPQPEPTAPPPIESGIGAPPP
jgi:vancomycin resistance protein YoaR